MIGRKYKIRAAISWAFCGLLIISTLITTTYTFINIETAMDRTARDLIYKTQTMIVNETLDYLKPAMDITQMGSWLFKSVTQQLGPEFPLVSYILNNPVLMDFMLAGLHIYPQTNLIYAADINGNYVAIGNLAEKRMFVYKAKQPLPHNVVYFTEIVERQQDIKNFYRYLTTNGDVLAEEYNPVVGENTYDPRKRKWFERTVACQAPNWSEVYIGWNTTDFMITASSPVFGVNRELIGIIAVDIPLERVGDLLSKQKASRSGINFIINPQGEVISFPEAGRNILFRNGIPSIKYLGDMNEPSLMEAYRLYQMNHKNQFEFTYGSIDFYAHFMEFPNEFASPWILAMVAPVDDFVGPIKETNRDVLLIALFILGISSIFLVVFSHKISYPIENLAEQMHRIKDLNINNEDDSPSSLQEISQMEKALVLMKDGLGAFSKFVPKELVRSLISGHLEAKLGGQRKSLVIMFCDIAQFTSIAEGMDSDQLMMHLSDYLNRMSGIILKNKGTIDKYIGDSIMAFWGAPVDDDDRIYHGCHAVLTCHRRLLKMNEDWKNQGKAELPTRFGLHYGDVVVGNMGSSDRLNYTVIGDNVNLTSRLENVNKIYGTHILMTEAIVQAVHDQFLTRPIDIVAVKGKVKGIKIYELLAEITNDIELQPLGNQTTIATLTAEAFGYYLKQEWDTAKEIYQTILKFEPTDQVALLYIKRCQKYKKLPPLSPWDGVYHLETK